MDILILAHYSSHWDTSKNGRFTELANMLCQEHNVEIVTSDFDHGAKNALSFQKGKQTEYKHNSSDCSRCYDWRWHSGCGWCGAQSEVSHNLEITNDCMIGAGAVVVKNITGNGIYKGVAARRN